MPFMLAIIGITLLVTAVRNTTGELFSLIKSDFTGSGNYIWWIVSILAIGSLGYVKRLQPIVNMFILLILVVMFIGAGKKGFFAQFMDAIKNPATNCGSGNPGGPITSLGPANGIANGIVTSPSSVLDWSSMGLLSGKGDNTGSRNLGNGLWNIINGSMFKPTNQGQ